MITDWRFCPRCAAPLERGPLAGRERQRCASGCGFVHWDNPTPVVAALIQLGDRIVLARNAAWPPGAFALVTGFLERDESPEEGMVREVREETGLEVVDRRLIGVYEFRRKNELLIAWHVQARGTIRLSEELAEVQLVAPEALRPWPMGTGLAIADWLRARGLPVRFTDPPLPRPDAAAPLPDSPD